MSQLQVQLAVTADGTPLLDSYEHRDDGSPRFRLALVRDLINSDPGVQYILLREKVYDGYEGVTRRFFDEHLEPGDLFLDIGSHWGIFALSAATRFPGQVQVLAVEPHPQNIMQVMKSVAVNRLHEQIEVVPAAAGEERGTALLRCISSMGHSLDASTPRVPQVPLRVPVVTVDELVEARRDRHEPRIFLKVDVEGFEYEVLLGARRTLASGRVQAVMWEKGDSYASPAGREKFLKLIEELRSHGFALYRFPSSEYGGPLLPFAPTQEIGNVFALAAGFPRREVYPQPFDKRPPYNTLFSLPGDPVTRGETTRLLLEVRGSDGARWANPLEVPLGAPLRAQTAAAFIAPGRRVLDLGAGCLALGAHLPPGCQYMPADLLARSADCAVVDLNQGQFPPGDYDVIVMLELLEYIHDVPGLLARARGAARRLVLIYHPSTGETAQSRRQQGWFNDYARNELLDLLANQGWRVDEQLSGEFGLLCSCSANG